MSKAQALLLFFLIIGHLPVSEGIQVMPDEQDQFEKIFGKSSKDEKVNIPAYYNGRILRDISVTATSDGLTVKNYLRNDVVDALKGILIKEELDKIKTIKKTHVYPEDLNFKIIYDSEQTILSFKIDPILTAPQSDTELRGQVLTDITPPAEFSGILNINSNKTITDNQSSNNLNLNIESSLNFKSYVLENSLMKSSYDNKFIRNRTTLVKENILDSIVYKIGDITSINKGFMDSFELGGLSIIKNNPLSPGESSYGNYNEYILTGKSHLRYYVNGFLYRVTDLEAGRYFIKDLPLDKIINNIKIEIVDEYGVKKTLSFNESYSDNILKEGYTKYGISVGKKVSYEGLNRKYQNNETPLISAFIEKGISKYVTNSVYSNLEHDRYLIGQDTYIASRYGLFDLGIANSAKTDLIIDLRPKESGSAFKIGYQSTLGSSTYFNHKINLSLEERGQGFRPNSRNERNFQKRKLQAVYSHAISDSTSINVAVNKLSYFNKLIKDSYGINLGVNYNLSRATSVNTSISHSHDSSRSQNNSVALMFNFSIPDNGYLSYNLNTVDSAQRLNYSKTMSENGLTPSTTLEVSDSHKNVSGGLAYLNRYSIASINGSSSKYSNNHIVNSANINLGTSILFAYDKGVYGLSLSRPVLDSAAIFKPTKYIRDQEISISNVNKTQNSQGIFKELVIPNLSSNQYSTCQLDPSALNYGYSLDKENFNFSPTYKSVSIVEVGKPGEVSLKGNFIDGSGQFIKSTNGEAILANGETIPFFSNNKGRFFIESVPFGEVTLKLEDPSFEPVKISISQDQKGLIDLGNIPVK